MGRDWRNLRFHCQPSQRGEATRGEAITCVEVLYRDEIRQKLQPISAANTRLPEALAQVGEQIYDSYRNACIETYRKIGSNALELSCWRQHKVFVTRGGSLLPFLVDKVRMHPDEREPLSVMTLEQPIDLVRVDHKKITSEELPFVTVAYGLSNMEAFLPNPYCRDSGRKRTVGSYWHHQGEEY